VIEDSMRQTVTRAVSITAFFALLTGSLLGAVMTEAKPAAGSSDQERSIPGRTEVAPGLVIERIPAALPSPVQKGDGLITLVRIDPRRYELRLLTAAEHGMRTAPKWVEDFDLTGVINASMFLEDMTSTGLMVDGDRVNNGRVNRAFGAFLAFGPHESEIDPVVLAGRPCAGFDLDAIRRSYDVVIQNYRMLDCDGTPIAWKDGKAYSIAAVGLDRDGWVVFIHSRAPYLMRDFNRMIAADELRIEQAMFVEGGPAASLFVKSGDVEVREAGSFESGFMDGSNSLFWAMPNVIGFAPLDD
jgi:uncharacterized protein YigE (DUF2233 family)